MDSRKKREDNKQAKQNQRIREIKEFMFLVKVMVDYGYKVKLKNSCRKSENLPLVFIPNLVEYKYQNNDEDRKSFDPPKSFKESYKILKEKLLEMSKQSGSPYIFEFEVQKSKYVQYNDRISYMESEIEEIGNKLCDNLKEQKNERNISYTIVSIHDNNTIIFE